MSTIDSPLGRGHSRYQALVLVILLGPLPFAAAQPTFRNDNAVATWGTYLAGDAATRPVQALAASSDGVVLTRGRFGSADSGLEALVKFDDAGQLQWSAFYGGGAGDGTAAALASLPSRDLVYVAGYTTYDAGIATSGAQQAARACDGAGACGNDGFVAQFDASGALRWGTYLGGLLNDYIYAAAADSDGDLYVCGQTDSASGIATADAQQTREGPGFLAKYGLGGDLKWATHYDGPCTTLAVDPTGAGVVIAGWATADGDFATEGALQPDPAGPNNTYLARFSAAGQRQWGSYFGEGHAGVHALEIDRAGAVYVVGATDEHDDLVTDDAEQERYGGGQSDLYIARITAAGDREWGTYFGGDSPESNAHAAIDGAGNLYFSATTSSDDLATIGDASATIGERSDVIIGKLGRDGTLEWAFYQGGEGQDRVTALAVDAQERVYVGGVTQSDTGIATTGAPQAVRTGLESPYVTTFRTAW